MGITSREDIAIVSKDLKNSRGTNFAPRKIQFAHEFTGGETSLNLLSLTTPTDLAGAGFVNASPSEIASAHLSVFGKNLRLSLSRGLELKPFAHYLISGNSVIFRGSLRDSGGAMPGEILFGEIDSVSSSGLVVGDVRFEHGTIEVIEGQTSVSIGYPFKVNANPSEQVGDLKLWRNGVRIYRNVGNAAASPSADGNYHEVDSGTGYGTTIQLNSAPVGQSDIIEFEVGLKIASGDMSTWDALERLEGSILALAGDVKDLGPFDITRYIAAAPSAIERKMFGSIVLAMKDMVDAYVGENLSALRQYNLTVTDTNWTTTRAVGIPYRTIDGVWRLRFNISGTYSVGTTLSILTIAGVTFGPVAQTFATYLTDAVRDCLTNIARTNTNGSLLTMRGIDYTVANTIASITGVIAAGDVELASKPTWVP